MDGETFLDKINKQVQSLVAFKMISDGTSGDQCSRENTQENSAESQPHEEKPSDQELDVASPSQLVITNLGRATVKGFILLVFLPLQISDFIS